MPGEENEHKNGEQGRRSTKGIKDTERKNISESIPGHLLVPPVRVKVR